MAMYGGGNAGIDLVDQRVEAAGGPVAVPAHVDAGAQTARGLLEPHILLPDHGLAVVAPFLEEFLPAFFLDVVVRRGGLGLGGHGARA
jgi:hypothetical protein